MAKDTNDKQTVDLGGIDWRVNYNTIINGALRSASIIVTAQTKELARQAASEALRQEHGDRFRISSVKPW